MAHYIFSQEVVIYDEKLNESIQTYLSNTFVYDVCEVVIMRNDDLETLCEISIVEHANSEDAMCLIDMLENAMLSNRGVAFARTNDNEFEFYYVDEQHCKVIQSKAQETK